MAAFVHVNDGIDVPDATSEAHQVQQILHWCGFTQAASRNRIFSDSFGSYEDINLLKPSDIDTMAKDFANRQATQRVNFGVRRTKKLKAAVHFVADFH